MGSSGEELWWERSWKEELGRKGLVVGSCVYGRGGGGRGREGGGEFFLKKKRLEWVFGVVFRWELDGFLVGFGWVLGWVSGELAGRSGQEQDEGEGILLGEGLSVWVCACVGARREGGG